MELYLRERRTWNLFNYSELFAEWFQVCFLNRSIILLSVLAATNLRSTLGRSIIVVTLQILGLRGRIRLELEVGVILNIANVAIESEL